MSSWVQKVQNPQNGRNLHVSGASNSTKKVSLLSSTNRRAAEADCTREGTLGLLLWLLVVGETTMIFTGDFSGHGNGSMHSWTVVYFFRPGSEKHVAIVSWHVQVIHQVEFGSFDQFCPQINHVYQCLWFLRSKDAPPRGNVQVDRCRALEPVTPMLC